MSVIIDSNVFEGENEGLVPPLRRLTDGAFGLTIVNLDRADPPSYQPGSVPRGTKFNANVLSLKATPAMPRIDVVCDVKGFDPATVNIHWRLQTLQVLGRFQKAKKKKKTDPSRYNGKIVRLADEWTGTSSAAKFALFADPSDVDVTYDNASDRVAGGHAILTVAVKPPGAAAWMQDYVHIRIVGKDANPDEWKVRAYCAALAAAPGRDKILAPMLNAIFAWEANFKQFRATAYGKDTYEGVLFDWPDDPANHPVASFDFGIGISQFTHPDQLTTAMAWDWRVNLNAGINIFLDDLRRRYEKDFTWSEWAWWGWRDYNNSGSYADKRKKSADGKLVPGTAIPSSVNIKAFTEPIPLSPAPKKPKWPVTALDHAFADNIAAADDVTGRFVDAIAEAVAAKVRDPALLSWAWPKLMEEFRTFDAHAETTLFPDLKFTDVQELVAALDRPRLDHFLDLAFDRAFARVNASAATQSPLAEFVSAAASPPIFAASFSPAQEFAQLSKFVRDNVDGGVAAWPNLRQAMFATFGAPGDPNTAIPRINAYYTSLVAAKFPPTGSASGRDSPVHPNLKARLDAAVTLLTAKGHAAVLATLKSVGGFSIRKNVNNPDKLSNHSFGWALDLDPKFNPNTKKQHLPLDLIVKITKVDLYGPESTRLRSPRPFDQTLPDARVLSDANTTFVAAFKDMPALKTACGETINRLFGATLATATIDQAFGFAAPPANTTALRNLLAAAGIASGNLNTCTKFLKDAVALFKQAQAPGVKPEILGTAASVTKFGFFNMPAPLAAALVASDGAGLFWLGSANGTKDYMHSELFEADQPDLF
ncbi:MAG: hypothetical protein QOF14_2459 [Hyphomicrobiales bacterium]|nr:hypothetical protein [Hyphomicrobiales bacterium]